MMSVHQRTKDYFSILWGYSTSGNALSKILMICSQRCHHFICNNYYKFVFLVCLLLSRRISVENIELEFSSLYVRIKSLEEKVQGDEELLQQLEPFLQVKQQQLCNTLHTESSGAADSMAADNYFDKIRLLKEGICVFDVLSQSSAQTLQDLKRRRLDLRKEGNSLIDFFCEDKDTFKLDECFRIFQDFCIKFNKAVKVSLNKRIILPFYLKFWQAVILCSCCYKLLQ